MRIVERIQGGIAWHNENGAIFGGEKNFPEIESNFDFLKEKLQAVINCHYVIINICSLYGEMLPLFHYLTNLTKLSSNEEIFLKY